MYVVAEHRFTDPKCAWSRVREALGQQGPANLKLHHSFPTRDGARAACLWEAPSATMLQGFLNRVFEGVATNDCYEVENSEGVALPSTLMPQQSHAGETERNVAIVKSAYDAFL